MWWNSTANGTGDTCLQNQPIFWLGDVFTEIFGHDVTHTDMNNRTHMNR